MRSSALAVLSALLVAARVAVCLAGPVPGVTPRQPVQATDPPGVSRVFHIQPFVENPFQTPSAPVTVYYAVLERSCRSVLLSAPSEAPQVVRGASDADRRGTYNMSISWYRMGSDCAIPFFIMEFSGCPYDAGFGNCSTRTQPRWRYYDSFSAPSQDRLGIVMHAPAIETSGLYNRLIKVNDWAETTQFILEHHDREPCMWALPLHIPRDSCLSASEFAAGVTVDAIGMVPRFIPENQRAVSVYSLQRAGWDGPHQPYGSMRLPPETAAGVSNATPPPLLFDDTLNPLVEEPPVAPYAPPSWKELPIGPDPAPAPAKETRGSLLPALIAAGAIATAAILGAAACVAYRRKRAWRRRVRLPRLAEDE
ncbi:envelope glycoprotein D [Leporid alphaherpesvirus 4]|uniref:Envelope glycoprotein D n=1 Tax=Leporid alphaherpesvirus 4 TaxID=481315 RepID=J9R099_9ALPH|nr:envelope glycoprotein D [Leporid alphaherpesvirus 4]AFR32507.1 envelope glycoprotein D [Leporid alphaherpesvirus 4]